MKIAVIAGEKSGDNYGAFLIDALKKIEPGIYTIGTGGEGIRKRADLFIECLPSGRMGFSGVISQLPIFYRAFRKVKNILEKEIPDIVVFIDNPGFNLKLAESIGRAFPCYYYIPPKVWAHHYGRIKTIKRYIRAVITIFPFEKDIYQNEGIPAFWFGHPVVDLIQKEDIDRDKEKDVPVIGLLPGSRIEEVRYLLPVFLRIVKLVSKKRRIEPILSASDADIKKVEETILKRYHTDMEIIEGNPHRVIKESSMLLAASGTVNLEVVLLKRPLLVFYKTTYLNYILGRIMIKLDVISPVNIMAGGKVIPEYI
ncbi:MAG: lipid-A-disaccharide synthase, partial [Candidatus Ratteibacteria bacterium]|nr:lipid-A-disaccharide synthase [Candidatus Ratteibacteria bacterium]